MYSMFGTPMPSRTEIAKLRKDFPHGARVELERMDDKYAPAPGTKGTVEHVDDLGTVHVSWDNGSRLGAVYGADKIRRI